MGESRQWLRAFYSLERRATTIGRFGIDYHISQNKSLMDEMLRVEISDISIEDLWKAQRRVVQAFLELQPSGALGEAVQDGTMDAFEYMLRIVHEITTRLRASLYPYMAQDNLYGAVGTNLSYAEAESLRPGVKRGGKGGGHDFLERTANEAGPDILMRMMEYLIQQVTRRWHA